MLNLDNIDHKILREVQKDASLSMEELAERVSLSRNACWRRLKSLEENDVIRKRVALVDPAKVGCGLEVLVLIRISGHDRQWMNSFGRAVRMLPQIVGAHRMTGDLDYVLRVRVADVAGYDQFYKDLISHVQVSDISASFVMETIKDTTEIPL